MTRRRPADTATELRAIRAEIRDLADRAPSLPPPCDLRAEERLVTAALDGLDPESTRRQRDLALRVLSSLPADDLLDPELSVILSVLAILLGDGIAASDAAILSVAWSSTRLAAPHLKDRLTDLRRLPVVAYVDDDIARVRDLARMRRALAHVSQADAALRLGQAGDASAALRAALVALEAGL